MSAWAEPVFNVRVGTCGWTEQGLIEANSFYPALEMTAQQRLRFYATRFPIVEVDSTFYSVPSEQNSVLWVERTPPHFVFNIKALGLFTQHSVVTRSLPVRIRELMAGPETAKPRVYMRSLSINAQTVLWTMFRGALEPLDAAGKLGAVLFQFPAWFTKNRDNVRYLEALRDLLPYRIAVEFRGGDWMEEHHAASTLQILQRCGYIYCAVDEPQGFRSSTPPVLATTAPQAMFRLHGRNAQVWEAKDLPNASHRFNYLYTQAELKDLTKKVGWLAEQADEVHVLFNNNFRDYHVRNAQTFGRMLERLRKRGELPQRQMELPMDGLH